MKSIVIFILLAFGMGLIQCETNNNNVPERIPPEDWIKGVWRSEYNDSIKFISDTLVYINSLLHYCKFEEDSIKILYWCYPEQNYRSYKYEFNITMNKFLLYDFSNIYHLSIIPLDSLFSLHNLDSTLFTKSNEKVELPFEEWIQGVWVCNNGRYHLSFIRPYRMKNSKYFQYKSSFYNNGIYYIRYDNEYVFTEDSLKIHYSTSSYLGSYSSYSYEFDKANDLLILYNYNKIDTAKFYKQ